VAEAARAPRIAFPVFLQVQFVQHRTAELALDQAEEEVGWMPNLALPHPVKRHHGVGHTLAVAKASLAPDFNLKDALTGVGVDYDELA